jgi:hypothetical protein
MQLAYTSNNAAAFRKRVTANSLSAVNNEIFPSAERTIGLSVAARTTFIFCLLGITVLQRFGVNVGFYTVNFSLISMYILLFYLLLSGWVKMTVPDTLNYCLCISLSFISYLLSDSATSFTSLALVAAIYFPFCFKWKIQENLHYNWLWLANTFVNICVFVGVCGLLQYIGQFFIHDQWLVDFSQYIPDPVRATQGYNTSIPVGLMYKSNGFFLLEPSSFSVLMAMALLCEWTLFRRIGRMSVLALGLLVSYSGTGILTLLLGAMFPLGPRTVVRALGLVALGGLVFFLLGDLLHLSFTLDRVSEFSTPGSSGSDRFVAPIQLLQEQIGNFSDIVHVLLGNGPGSITRAVRGYTFFDPTWARLFFEYGLLGSIAFLWFFTQTVNRFSSPIEIRAGLFFAWFIMGDGLATPECAAMIFMLAGLWQTSARGSSIGSIEAALPETTGRAVGDIALGRRQLALRRPGPGR